MKEKLWVQLEKLYIQYSKLVLRSKRSYVAWGVDLQGAAGSNINIHFLYAFKKQTETISLWPNYMYLL